MPAPSISLNRVNQPYLPIVWKCTDARPRPGEADALRLSGHATLEIAVTEDDGLHRGAPGIGLEAAIRWRP